VSARRLNPCPFCGHRPALPCEYAHDGIGERAPRAVICDACSAQGPFILPGTDGEPTDTEARARVAWNCRSH
jgi:hypothetical protein